MSPFDPDRDPLTEAFTTLLGEAHVPHLVVAVARDETRICAANEAARSLLVRDDLVGIDFLSLLEKDQLPTDEATWSAVFAGQLDVIGRRRVYRCGDGRAVVVDALAFTIRTTDTGILMLVVLAEPARTDWMLRRLRLDIEITTALSGLRAALLAGDHEEALLQRICDSTSALMDADNAAVLGLDGPDHVRLLAILDASAHPVGSRWRIIDDEYGRSLRESRAINFTLAATVTTSTSTRTAGPTHVAMEPLTAGDRTLGSLMVRRDLNPFTPEELATFGVFASAASDAMRLGQSLTEFVRLRVREQIARDLHDETIQDLVAVRLGLAGLSIEVDDVTLRPKVAELLEEVDRVTKRLRDVVRNLDEAATTSGFLTSIRSLTARRAERAGMDWSVEIDEPTAADLTPNERREFTIVVNEAVSNAVRHSEGTKVEVRLAAADGRAVLTVSDDGIGPDDSRSAAGRGLGNIRARASELGGGCALAPQPHGGARLEWWIPTRRLTGVEP